MTAMRHIHKQCIFLFLEFDPLQIMIASVPRGISCKFLSNICHGPDCMRDGQRDGQRKGQIVLKNSMCTEVT